MLNGCGGSIKLLSHQYNRIHTLPIDLVINLNQSINYLTEIKDGIKELLDSYAIFISVCKFPWFVLNVLNWNC